MLAHFGHFFQSPSGISRLRDLLEPSFGFFTKAVSELVCAGGGVTAGSTVSRPRVFLLNDEVAIIQILGTIHRTIAFHHGPASTHKPHWRLHPRALWRRRCSLRLSSIHHRSARYVHHSTVPRAAKQMPFAHCRPAPAGSASSECGSARSGARAWLG